MHEDDDRLASRQRRIPPQIKASQDDACTSPASGNDTTTHQAIENGYPSGHSEPSEAPSFFEWSELFPELQELLDGFAAIRAEMSKVGDWKAWPENHYMDGGSQDWKVGASR